MRWWLVKWYGWKLQRQVKAGLKGREKYAKSIESTGRYALGYMNLKDVGLRLLYWSGALEIEDAIYQADLEANGKKIGSMLFTLDVK